MTVDPATVRAVMTPVVQAAVLDAFKLGVGHAIRAIEGRLEMPCLDGYRPRPVIDGLVQELRAYVATMTYEDLP